jgi:hypothetical protein
VEPEFIVDNGLCKYNDHIISLEDFKKLYSDDIYVILTLKGDYSLNWMMEQELRTFVAGDKIINLLALSTLGGSMLVKKNNLRQVTDQFDLANILPGEKCDGGQPLVPVGTNNKIKVRLRHFTYNTWNSVKSICEAFEKDDKYDVLIIVDAANQTDIDRREAQMQEGSHSYIMETEYDVEADQPDIYIITHPYDSIQYIRVKENTKLYIAAPMMLIPYFIQGLAWSLMDEAWGESQPDYYLFDSMVYRELFEFGYKKDKLVEMGNAKYDGIFNACQKKVYPDDWQKLKGRQNVLWALDHGLSHSIIQDDVTFDLYAQTIFQYASEHPEMGLIFRPHVTLLLELETICHWTAEDFEKLREYCRKSPNVVFDENASYDTAIALADVILADSNCGITCTVLPTLKPICALYRPDHKSAQYHEDLLNCYYAARNGAEVTAFLDMVLEGRDEMYEQRKLAARKNVKHFDGKNGLRIKEFIEKKYYERISCGTGQQ